MWCDHAASRESAAIFVYTMLLVSGTLYAAYRVNDYSTAGPNADLQFSLIGSPFDRPTLEVHQHACRYSNINNMSISAKWRHRTCRGHQHEIKCALNRRRKLLVLYMHTYSTGYNIKTEYDNMRLFLANAVLAPDTPTKLYSAVDYVFTRISEQVDAPTIISKPRANVWFVHVPEKTTPCDLCAHGVVVKLLGINLHTDYDSVVYMNSGARGPYIQCNEHWMDVVTMVGNPLLPLLPDGSIDEKYRPVTAGYHALLWGGNLESWFIMAPRPAFGIVTELWREACVSHFTDCIYHAEVPLRKRVESELSMSTYAMCQATLLNGAIDSASIESAFTSSWLTEKITGQWSEPCKCIFIKFGGSTFRNKGFRAEYVDRVHKMVMSQMPPSLSVLYSPTLVPPVEWLLD